MQTHVVVLAMKFEVEKLEREKWREGGGEIRADAICYAFPHSF